MRFCVPFNNDMKLVDAVLEQYSDNVASLYGSTGIDKFGGGRALPGSQNQSIDSLLSVVKKLERENIEFNYVINSPNMLNREFDPAYRTEYKKFLDTLENLGVRTVTLSNLSFIELTHEYKPDFKISASVNMKTKTADEVKFLVDLGCREITLAYDVMKDPVALKEIRKVTDIDLKLIANDIYINGCPWQKGHARMQGAHSRNKEVQTPYFSYYRNKCVNLRHLHPEEVAKAMWIPPEQTWRYEKLGYDYFKLLDRLATTDWNLRALKTYVDAKPSGNLETVVGTYGAPATTVIPDLYSGSETPYPTKQLEVIPSIRSNNDAFSDLFRYQLSDGHPQQCENCSACFNASAQTTTFDEGQRLRAIENNRSWQRQITKIEFIRKLNGFNRRIAYE